ncbi:uncharacterized protein LOC126974566 [Leptidea sinapis]|uniref:uncharacterized protein LOC126974566 n=1 Tax=Leptidea sinapis TaxID=189913 RepID=UPI0021C271DC|nr:uncharacterized protein LOC126974566 [Leptidea sinapis]
MENTEETLLKYKEYIKSSRDLDKSDKDLLTSWSAEFHLSQVNITTRYRLDMTRHKEHNFRKIDASPKWTECLLLHDKEISKSERSYMTCEEECLRTVHTATNNERHSVHQLTKEIRKWRKSYRYLTKQCRLEYPSDEEAVGRCLVDYMRRDKFDIVIQRLLDLKLRSMSDLNARMTESLTNLEECLKSCLSHYLDRVRQIMININLCYNYSKKNS